MPNSVSVAVPARLHLGFLDLHGGLGRRFGSLGLALAEPRTRLTISRAAVDRVNGPEAERAARFLRAVRRHLGIEAAHAIGIDEAIPSHSGLGSGTQLALAVAAAVRRLHGLPLDPRGDAALLGRGERSGIGVGLFQSGGVVLDGGRGASNAPPPVVARLPFPAAWRVLLLLDPARLGVHGPAELSAFAALPPFPEATAAELCRLAVMLALPSLAEEDIDGFGRAVTEIQARIGDHFAAAQGGRFASPGVAAALNRLAACGVRGYGQSSWGPTGFVFAASAEEAAAYAGQIAPIAERAGIVTAIVEGCNAPARIEEKSRDFVQGLRHG